MQPTRYSINGSRYYLTDKDGIAYPSVTTILGKTATANSKKILENWNRRNPGMKEKAAIRGSAIHEQAERYLRNFKLAPMHEDHAPFWEGMPFHLDKVDELLWSERAIPIEHQRITKAPDDMSRIWSHRFKYAGTPDLVYRKNQRVVMGDYKTSNTPYCRYYPREKEMKKHWGGWSKFVKCATQLGGYAIAYEETLGIKVDATQIIVSTTDVTQNFYIQGRELEKFKTRWLQRVHHYWQIIAEEEQDAIAAEWTGAAALAAA